MNKSDRCPQCDSPLPQNAPQGLCPKCLMQQALDSEAPASGRSPTTPWQGAFQPPEPAELAASFPQLEVMELLGQGGMGAVYKARQVGLDRLVALKILPPEAAADPAFAERFTRESRALAKLSHPNIVSVYDSGQASFADASGRSSPLYYFLMEYVDGVNLRAAQQTEALSPQQALQIIPQVCDALQYAHDQGIVHRDIKPENVLLDKSGRVKVADFGLSKLLARAPVNITLTASHQVMGTLHYMAPEQIQHPLEVDHRADIYSLGVVFYELLTGEVPIGRFPLPSEMLRSDARLDDVVLKAMEREPDRRYQQASHVKSDLELLTAAGCTPEPPWHKAASGDSRGTRLGPHISDEEWLHARRQVNGPAIGLIVTGIVNLLPLALVVLAILGALVFWSVQSVPSDAPVPVGAATPAALSSVFMAAPGFLEILIILLLLGFNLPGGVVMIAGGLQMRKLESYGLVMTASILSLLPCMSAFFLGLPVGIWSLIVLNRDEVKAAFGKKPELTAGKTLPKGDSSETGSPPDRGSRTIRYVIALILLLSVTALIAAILLRLFSGETRIEPIIYETY